MSTTLQEPTPELSPYPSPSLCPATELTAASEGSSVCEAHHDLNSKQAQPRQRLRFPAEIEQMIISRVDSYATYRELHKIKCFRPIIAKCVTYLNIGVDETLTTRISEQKVEIINDTQLDFSKVENILKISKIKDVLSEDSIKEIKKNSPLICIQIAASSLKTLKQTTDVIFDKMSVVHHFGQTSRIHVECFVSWSDYDNIEKFTKELKEDIPSLGRIRKGGEFDPDSCEICLDLSHTYGFFDILPSWGNWPADDELYDFEYKIHDRGVSYYEQALDVKPTMDLIIANASSTHWRVFGYLSQNTVLRTLKERKLKALESLSENIMALALEEVVVDLWGMKAFDIDSYEMLWSQRDDLKHAMCQAFGDCFTSCILHGYSKMKCPFLPSRCARKYGSIKAAMSEVVDLVEWALRHPQDTIRAVRFNLIPDECKLSKFLTDDTAEIDKLCGIVHANFMESFKEA